MNNKSIGKCENCDQEYCYECTEGPDWLRFCSDRCANEFRAEESKETPKKQMAGKK